MADSTDPTDSSDNLINNGLAKDEVLYEDSKIIITGKEIVLKLYYFPIGTKRIIRMKSIRSFKLYQPRSFFSLKSWGMGEILRFGGMLTSLGSIKIDTLLYSTLGAGPALESPREVGMLRP